MVGTLRLGGEYASNEWRAAAGAMSNGQKICPISAKEQSVEGICSFLDTHGFCNYVHTDESRGSSGKTRGQRKVRKRV